MTTGGAGDCSEGSRRTKTCKAQKDAQSAAEVADREQQITQTKKSRATSSRRRARECAAKADADVQKICDGILALMDKNLIPSARRIAEAEDHQQRSRF